MNNTRLFNESVGNSSEKIADLTLESLEFKYTKVAFYFLILFCATFGNLMVIYVICTSKRMRSASHLLILNLAVCDFFTPLISIPFDFALEENGYVWFYGDFMCKILYPAATFSTTASSLTLAAISLDRYRLLMHPFKKKLSSNQIKVIILAIYVFCAAVVSPYAYVLNVVQADTASCEENWPRFLYRQLYTMCLFLFQYAIPLTFMTIMYTLAIKNLYATSGKVRHCSIQQHSGNERNIHMNGSAARKKSFLKINFKSAFRKKKFKLVEDSPNVKATKMFMAIVVVFAVFMFPNQVLWLWVDFGNGKSYAQIAIICWLFTYTNSVVNPIIFALFSKDFRMGFKGVFRLIFCCNRDALPGRCHRRTDFNTKSDSLTNEILREKDRKSHLSYDISTSHSNIQDKDTPVVLTKEDTSYHSTSSPNKDFNHNKGLNEIVRSSDCEARPAFSLDLVIPIGQPFATNKTQPSQKRKEDRIFSSEKLEEIQRQLTCDSEGEHTRHESEIPILSPNTIAILDQLPETDC